MKGEGGLPGIRRRRGVPAYRGRTIRFEGRECRIVGSAPGDRLRVRFPPGATVVLHPTWRIDYQTNDHEHTD